MFLLTNDIDNKRTELVVEQLKSGARALDVVEKSIRAVELSGPHWSVGPNGRPDISGRVTLDASILCGKTFRAGSVGALHGYKHPISIARQVMEKLPHVMLAGEGAGRFAKEIGAERIDLMGTPAFEEWEDWFNALSTATRRNWTDAALIDLCCEQINKKESHDTVIFLVQDASGEIAVGASTSGWGMKYPGRLGDSPVIGASVYGDSRFGAVGCTHTGEMALRSLPAHTIITLRNAGYSLAEAVTFCINDISKLKGGLLDTLVIHAIDENGIPDVVAINAKIPSAFYHWNGSAPPSKQIARSIEIDYTASGT